MNRSRDPALPFLCPCAHFKKPFKGILRSKKPLHCATSCGKCNEIIISLSCRLTRIRVCDIEILHDLAQIHGSRGWLYFSVKVFGNSTTVGKFGKLIASARSSSRCIVNITIGFDCNVNKPRSKLIYAKKAIHNE